MPRVLLSQTMLLWKALSTCRFAGVQVYRIKLEKGSNGLKGNTHEKSDNHWQTDHRRARRNTHSHPQGMRVLFSCILPMEGANNCPSFFANMMDEKWHLSIVLITIFLTLNTVSISFCLSYFIILRCNYRLFLCPFFSWTDGLHSVFKPTEKC